MKKILFGLLGLFGFLGVGLSLKPIESPAITYAEEEETIYPCVVLIEKSEHGTITADKLEGEIGETITLEVKNDFLYTIDYVVANGNTLIESETTKGIYTFKLKEGENTVKARFIVDESTLGIFSDMYQEAVNKDWINLFSVENVVTIVKWVLDGGILLVVIRYFIKDKKLASAVEGKVEETMNKIVPDTTQAAVVKTVEKVLAPVFAQLESQSVSTQKAIGSLVKCIALMQENTPESRKAIIDELTGLDIGDSTTLGEIKAYIEKTIKEALEFKEETLKTIESIKDANKKIIENEEEHSEEGIYDGTTI